MFHWFTRKSIRKPRTIIAIILLGVVCVLYILTPNFFDTVPYSPTMYSRQGQLLDARIAQDEQWRFGPWQDTLPYNYRRALLTFEDKRFYFHLGIDPLAVGRALLQNIQGNTIISGASTLTMQVARLHNTSQHTWQANKTRQGYFQKMIQTIHAIQMELTYSKQQILAMYATHAPMGGNIVGLHAASYKYFKRPPSSLSWAEASLLAVLPNNPAYMHPGKNKTKLRAKRNRLLQKLLQQNDIDSLQYQLAIHEPLPQGVYSLPHLAPHYLQKMVQTQPSTHHALPYHTTIDYALQKKAQALVNRYHTQLQKNNIFGVGLIIRNNADSSIVAYCGNTSASLAPRYSAFVDMAAAPRSTGSILKPFLYASMLDAGELFPQTLLSDIPTKFRDYQPENFDRNYLGAVSAQQALIRSLNIPAVRMLHDYGVERFYHTLKTLGLSTLHRKARDYGLSLILGGAEATLTDVSLMYSHLAHTVATTPQANHNPQGSITPAAAWLTLSTLQELNRPGLEEYWRNYASSRPIAWKTGTSIGHRDAWAVGVTPTYTIAVLAGNADGEGRPEIVGITSAAPLLFQILNILPPEPWFTKPNTQWHTQRICPISGHPAGPHCPHTITIQTPPFTAMKVTPCPYHKIIHTNQNHTHIVNAQCYPHHQIQSRTIFQLPPLEEWYYKSHNPTYEIPPPVHPLCHNAATPQIGLLYPTPGLSLYLPKELDGNRNPTIFAATHRNPRATLHWHLNQSYLGSTTQDHRMPIQISQGQHTLTLIDTSGEILQRVFTVLN